MTETRKPKAYTLAADEKTTLVMLYTSSGLIRGEVITKASMRVSIWLRTQSAPEFIHLLKANVLTFGGGGPAKSASFPELIVPTEEVLAFHMAPPTFDPLDYEESEVNRVMEPVSVLVGTFHIDGCMRLSTQSDVSTNLNVAHSKWISLYDITVSNPHLANMGVMKAPMTLIKISKVIFGLDTASTG